MQNGKARLIRDDYCDGLGNCLPACPAGAISFEMREAAPYDEEAVKAHLARREQGGCEGSRGAALQPGTNIPAMNAGEHEEYGPEKSALRQWPVQIKLVPAEARFFDGADLLIAADCTAYACGSFHSRFMLGKVTLIGCTKLDDTDYSEKTGGDFPQERYKKHHRGTNGRTLLWRHGKCRARSPAQKRPRPALYGDRSWPRRTAFEVGKPQESCWPYAENAVALCRRILKRSAEILYSAQVLA